VDVDDPDLCLIWMVVTWWPLCVGVCSGDAGCCVQGAAGADREAAASLAQSSHDNQLARV